MPIIRQFIRAPEEEIRENFYGSEGTGSDGDINRVYSLITNLGVNITKVFLDGLLLLENTQYIKSNINKQVIMLNQPVFDSQVVSIFYLV